MRKKNNIFSCSRYFTMLSGGLLRSLPVSRSSISPLVWRWSLAVFPAINRRHRSSLAGYSSSWAEVSLLLGKLLPSVSSSREDFWPAANITCLFSLWRAVNACLCRSARSLVCLRSFCYRANRLKVRLIELNPP
jgi:hypothetical protein